MKTLAQIQNQYLHELAHLYSPQEIDIIFYALAETYLHKDKTILKLGLHEMREGEDLKNLLFQAALFRLMSGEPYQYVIGYVRFYGCDILVNSHVLIPRPETEELVDYVLREIKDNKDKISIMDLCTGSGCIAIALAKNLSESHVSALEVDEKAIEIAKKNSSINQVKIDFIHADLLNLENQTGNAELDIIVSNPPYIRESEKKMMDDRVLKYEPSQALFVPDDNPLIFYKKIIDFSGKNLKSSGKVYVEINQELGKDVKELFSQYFKDVNLIKDISGNYRILSASEKLL